jgi:hypothetical protein
MGWEMRTLKQIREKILNDIAQNGYSFLHTEKHSEQKRTVKVMIELAESGNFELQIDHGSPKVPATGAYGKYLGYFKTVRVVEYTLRPKK